MSDNPDEKKHDILMTSDSPMLGYVPCDPKQIVVLNGQKFMNSGGTTVYVKLG